jgi:hypothetical protein
MKNIILEVFQMLGGKEGMARWAKSHRRDFYSVFRADIAAVTAEVSPETAAQNKAAMAAVFEQAFMGAVRAAQRGEPTPTDVPMIDGIIDVRPVRHDISDAAARDTPTPQPTKPSTDGVTPKPKPEVQHTRRVAPNVVVSLYAASALGEGAPPDYGLNWSQTSAYPGRRFP